MAKRAGVEWFRAARKSRPLVFGHRGVRGSDAVENTMGAFEQAAAEGADGVELDVRVCATGELCVFHDVTLTRLTKGADERGIAGISWEELQRIELDAGSRVPLLRDVLRFARARGLRVNVEMKRDAPNIRAIVRATASLLRAWDPNHAILVSSFDPWMLTELTVLAPEVPRGLLVHRSWYSGAAIRAATPLRVDALHVERTLASPDSVRKWRAARVLNVWTVNDEREARDLSLLGVDSIITDRPGSIRNAIES